MVRFGEEAEEVGERPCDLERLVRVVLEELGDVGESAGAGPEVLRQDLVVVRAVEPGEAGVAEAGEYSGLRAEVVRVLWPDALLYRVAAVEEGDARELYSSLLASEARHHGIYLTLATELVGRAVAEARLEEMARHEAEVVAAPCEWVRLHAG